MITIAAFFLALAINAADAPPKNETDKEAATAPVTPAPAAPKAPSKLPEGRVLLAHLCLRYKGARGTPKAFNRSKEQSREIVEKLHAELTENPGKWEELVRKHSDDTRSAKQKGLISVFPWNRLPVYAQPVAHELAKLKKGEISRVIESTVGIHIFRCHEAIPLGFLEIVIGYKGSKIAGFMARREITRSKEEALAVAKRVSEEARAPGADFDAVAAEHTDMLDLEGYARGYRLFKGFTALPQIAEALSQLEIGQVADPVESPYGYHVVKRMIPEINAREILIRYKQSEKEKDVTRTEAEAKSLAEEVLAKLKAGEKTFQELARLYSDDEKRRALGGNLGVVPLRYFYPPVERAAFALKPGQTTGVLKGFNGYKIVQRY